MTPQTNTEREALRTYSQVKASTDPLDRLAVYINGLSPHNLWKAREAIDLALTHQLDRIEAGVPKFNRDQFNLLGCEKHWSDDNSKECTCDENIRNVEKGHNEAIDAFKAVIEAERGKV